MNLSVEQIDFINENDYVVFVTCCDDMPRAALVVPSRVGANEIIISDVLMKNSNENVKKNPNIFICSYNNEASKGVKISGTAKYYNDGALFEEIKAFEETRGFSPKGIIVVKMDQIKECTSDE